MTMSLSVALPTALRKTQIQTQPYTEKAKTEIRPNPTQADLGTDRIGLSALK